MAKLVLPALAPVRPVDLRPSRLRAVPPEYVGDPIHLTANAVGIQAGSVGVGINAKALMNTGPGPVEIYGIKFRVRCVGVVPSGALISCKLNLGSFPLTNGFVPVYLFGRAEQLVGEQVAGVGNSPSCYAQYVARLSRPIYLPAGAAISAQFQHNGQSSVAADAQISIFGRRLNSDNMVPDHLMLPFWAATANANFTIGANEEYVSTQNELYNPFDVPLEMERFIGRLNFFSGAALAFPSAMVELEQSGFAQTPAGGLSSAQLGDVLQQVHVQIVDSNGYPVVKRPTPFRLAFEADSRSWPVDFALSKGGFYIVHLYNFSQGLPAPYGGQIVYVQPSISMHGWREVKA